MTKFAYISSVIALVAFAGMTAVPATAFADMDAQAEITALKAELKQMADQAAAQQKAANAAIQKLAEKVDQLQAQTSRQVSKVDDLQKLETKQVSTVADLQKQQMSEAKELSAVEPASGNHGGGVMNAGGHNWAGPYAGANIGGGVATASVASNNTFLGAPPAANLGGGIFQGGLHAGYNNQMGNGVFGAEAEINLGSQNLRTLMGPFATTTTYKSRVDWSAAVLGRAGLAVGDTLFFADAGPALARLNGATACPGCGTANNSFTSWVPGIKGGIGAEMMVTQNVSLRAQYSLLDLVNKKVSPPISAVASAGWENMQQTATIGADWHF